MLTIGFYHYATVHTNTKAIFIGGMYSSRTGSETIDYITQFNDAKWTSLGRLQKARTGHNALIHNGYLIIVGGRTGKDGLQIEDMHSEISWKGLETPNDESNPGNGGQLLTIYTNPLFSNYYMYPALFIVNKSYCS